MLPRRCRRSRVRCRCVRPEAFDSVRLIVPSREGQQVSEACSVRFPLRASVRAPTSPKVVGSGRLWQPKEFPWLRMRGDRPKPVRLTRYLCGCRCDLPPDDTPCPAGMHEASPVGPTMGQRTMRHVQSVSPDFGRVPSDPLGQAPSWPSGSPLQVMAGGRMRPQHCAGPKPRHSDRCRRLRGIRTIHLSKIAIFEKDRFGCAPGCTLPVEQVDVDDSTFVARARNVVLIARKIDQSGGRASTSCGLVDVANDEQSKEQVQAHGNQPKDQTSRRPAAADHARPMQDPVLHSVA